MSDLRYNQFEKTAVAIVVKTQVLASMTAGTIYSGILTPSPILDLTHDGVGGFGNSSITSTNSVLTNEVATTALVVNNGDYFINYKTGYYYIKAGASATPTLTWYVKIMVLDATGLTATIGAVTIANGADTTKGAIADAAVSTDANGTLSAKLRGIIKLLIAKIGITEADGDNVAIGALADAAVVTSASGSLSAKVRGIIALLVAKINVKVADGDNITVGTTTDTGVSTDTTGTVIGFLRGLVKIFADIWDSTNHWFRVSLPAATVVTLTPPAAITGFATSALQLAAGHTVTPIPNGTGASGLSAVDSASLEASHIIKASAGILYHIRGYSVSTQYILIFNSASVPVDTTVAQIIIPVAAGTSFSEDFGSYGKVFTTGISWSNSSTIPAKTIGSSDCLVNSLFK